MQTVSFGVLGASDFAQHFTARALHEAEGVRFAALATSSPAKAAPFRAFAPDLRVHDSSVWIRSKMNGSKSPGGDA